MRPMLRRSVVVVVALAIGIAAVASMPPARAAIVDAMSCALSTPCLEWDNTGAGDAVKGVSTKGNAIHGQTKYKSAGKSSGKAGVFGEDLSTSGNLDSGVSGVSTNGSGVVGTSIAYNGVEGFTTGPGTSGVYGQSGSANGFGVAGRNTAPTHDNHGAGVLADGGSNDDGLHAFANGAGANAIYAFSQAGSAIVADQGSGATAPDLYLQNTSNPANDFIRAVGASGDVLDLAGDHMTLNDDLIVKTPTGAVFEGEDATVPAVEVFGASTADTNLAFTVSDARGDFSAGVDDVGDLQIAGELFVQGKCVITCLQQGRRPGAVREYTPTEAAPTIEDSGEASLVNGRADVPLDPTFANVIDQNAGYIVTLTPEGDCRGLFVADRTPKGFTVRELQGGRSNVGFSYRIQARPFGVKAQRLPTVAVVHPVPPSHLHHQR